MKKTLSLLALVWFLSVFLAPLFAQNETQNDYWRKVFNNTDIDSLREANVKPEYCIKIDASKSVDPGNPGLVFEWEIGNTGEILRGTAVRPCFEKPGSYEIHLNIVDPFSDLVNVHDTTLNVFISANVEFTHRGSRRLAGSFQFNIPREFYGKKPNSRFVWMFEDGTIRNNSRSARKVYTRSGTYTVSVLEYEMDGDNIKLLSGARKSIPLNISVSN